MNEIFRKETEELKLYLQNKNQYTIKERKVISQELQNRNEKNNLIPAQ